MCGKVTHAHVRFLDDNVLKTVEVTDIKKFNPKNCTDFDKEKLYHVRWNDEADENDKPVFYKAHILLLGKSIDSINARLQKTRLKFPNKRALDLDSDDANEPTSDCSEVPNKKILKKQRTTVKNESNLKNLTNKINTLKSRKVEQRLDVEEEDSDESSRHSDVASERLCNLRYQKLKVKVSALRTQFEELKEKVNQGLDTMTQKSAVSMTRNKVNRQLFCEEENIVDFSLDDQSLRKDSTLQAEDIEDKISKLPRFAKFVITRDSEKVTRTHLGSGISIDEDVWDLIQAKSEHPKFVKDLATAIWGRSVIIHRSVDGRAAGRLPNQGIRKALTPLKLNTLRKCFEHRLKEKDYKGEQLARELKRMNCYLTELINDYIRRELKELKKSHPEVAEKAHEKKKEFDVTVETKKSAEEDNVATDNERDEITDKKKKEAPGKKKVASDKRKKIGSDIIGGVISESEEDMSGAENILYD